MYELLKMIHFLSFSAALGAGLCNQLVGLRLSTLPPDAMRPVGAIRLSFGAVSTIGLVLLWFTGLIMIVTAYGAALFLNTFFVLKIIAVLVLTALSIAANLTVSQAKKSGTPPDAQRMKRLGQSSLATGVIALIFAVLAFS